MAELQQAEFLLLHQEWDERGEAEQRAKDEVGKVRERLRTSWSMRFAILEMS